MQIFFIYCLRINMKYVKDVFPPQAVVITFFKSLEKLFFQLLQQQQCQESCCLKLKKKNQQLSFDFFKADQSLQDSVRAKKQLIQTTLLPQHCTIFISLTALQSFQCLIVNHQKFMKMQSLKSFGSKSQCDMALSIYSKKFIFLGIFQQIPWSSHQGLMLTGTAQVLQQG